MNDLIGTKELIFDAFVEMTSALGYENVSIRDIAKKVSINPASMYYHFESKRKMLEYAYAYYSLHQYDNRTPVSEMKKLIETASAAEMLPSFFYSFEMEDQKEYVRMVLITKIVYMRLFQDPAANDIFAEANKNNAEYVVSILKHGVNIGRIDPGFDLQTFADVLVGAMTFMGIKAFARPDYAVGQLEQEKLILALLTRLFATAMI